jgi:FixJ family two-component response regulator
MNAPDRLVAIVDDEEPIRQALGRLLRSAGIKAQPFASGIAFLESMPIPGLRCVVLDIHMPGMTGLEVEARLATSWPQLPVIFITGHEDPEAQRRALATHPLAFLHKPVDSTYLLGAIGSLK